MSPDPLNRGELQTIQTLVRNISTPHLADSSTYIYDRIDAILNRTPEQSRQAVGALR